ncbi:SpoIID/LytB domain-containing protein [bacterium]|nr:SpoIID/LytB domain-containing protein [bacterium]
MKMEFPNDAWGITSTIPVEVPFSVNQKILDLNNLFVNSDSPMQYIRVAEAHGFPRTCCAWIKGIYGFIRSFGVKRVIFVTGGDCSNTHSLMETLSSELEEIRTFSYPYPRSLNLLDAEISRFCASFSTTRALAEASGKTLEPIRTALSELDQLTWKDGLVSGFENFKWLVSSSDFMGNPSIFFSNLNQFLDLARNRKKSFNKAIKIGLLGIPPIQADLINIIEDRGVQVVYNEIPHQFAMTGKEKDLPSRYNAYPYPYGVWARLEKIKEEVSEISKGNLLAWPSYRNYFFYGFFAFFFLISTHPVELFAQKGEILSTLAGVDNEIVRIGLFAESEISTVRISAIKGTWTVTFQQFPSSNTSEPLFSQDTVFQIPEGEDVALDGSSKGFWGITSLGKELRGGYFKGFFSGGELLEIEIPHQPIRIFGGTLEVIKKEAFLSFVNIVPLRTFLISTVSNGIPSSELEAIKSQVVVSRTFSKYAMGSGRHASDSFDLCDKSHCLGYFGEVNFRELVELMVDAVKDKVMTFKGKVFFPFFQNICGGKISAPKDILGLENEAHKQIEDRLTPLGPENCFHSPSFSWRLELTPEKVSDFLEFSFAQGASGVYLKWDPTRIDPTGRITQIDLTGKRKKTVSGVDFFEKLKEYFGENAFKSLRIKIQPMRQGILFYGNGAGLGMGLCQMGADGLAKKGFDFLKVLSFYYPEMDGAIKIENSAYSSKGRKGIKDDFELEEVKQKVRHEKSAQKKNKTASDTFKFKPLK